jgi:hypothetical protein
MKSCEQQKTRVKAKGSDGIEGGVLKEPLVTRP